MISAPLLEDSVTSGAAAVNTRLTFPVIPIPPSSTVATAPDGLALMPVITGQASDSFAISDNASLKLAGDFITRPMRAEVHPTQAVLRASPSDTKIDASVRIDGKTPVGSPWILFGDSDSSHLEASAMHTSLGLTITHFGEALPSGATEFSITDLHLGTQLAGWSAVEDDFAPAHFIDLSDNDKLSRPSFERHDAGAVLSGNFVKKGAALTKTIDYETFFIDTPGVITVDEGVPQPFPWADLAVVMLSGSAAQKTIGRAGNRRNSAPGNPIRVAEPAFAPAATATLAREPSAAAAGSTYSDVQAALRVAIAAIPSRRDVLQIVGKHELAEVAAYSKTSVAVLRGNPPKWRFP